MGEKDFQNCNLDIVIWVFIFKNEEYVIDNVDIYFQIRFFFLKVKMKLLGEREVIKIIIVLKINYR